MAETTFMPKYYKDFKCLGNKCKFTCCQAWGINIGRADYMKIRNAKKSKELQDVVEKAFKRDKKNETDKNYAYMVFGEDNKCMMLNKEGLCGLQIECGAGVLPKICKIFPRTENDATMMERACSTGCERVVEMLMELPQGIEFCTEEEPSKYTRHLRENQARPIIKNNMEIRLICIEILQNRNYTLDDRMIILGLALKNLNQLEKENKCEEVMEWVLKHRKLMGSPSLQVSLSKLETDSRYSVMNNLRFIPLMQAGMGTVAKKAIDEATTNLGVETTEDTVSYQADLYEKSKENLKQFMGNPDILFENIMVNYFFGNFLPLQKGYGNIWEQYMLFCYIYSMMKLCTAAYMKKGKTNEDLVHILTVCSRGLIHATSGIAKLLTTVGEENKDDTLAHMAALIKG